MSYTSISRSSLVPLVSICCITYNHEEYIRDALNGFLMQQTEFPFEILIHDDASTDKTAEIVREYRQRFPESITAVFQTENQYSQGRHVISSLFRMARGKYIALCEGDDYWTDPLKLQKQVDFMEAHRECSISCHKVLHRYQDHEEKNHLFPDLSGDQIFTMEEMFRKYISSTCSIVFQRIDIEKFIEYLDGFWIGDIPLLFFYLNRGKMGYIDQVMGTYRKNEQSFMYPNYEKYRFPFLFDTYTKIKSRLRILGSEGLDNQISFYADELLKKHFLEKDYKKMREVIKKDISSIYTAKSYRRRRFVYYSLIAFFPVLYNLFKSIKSTILNRSKVRL